MEDMGELYFSAVVSAGMRKKTESRGASQDK